MNQFSSFQKEYREFIKSSSADESLTSAEVVVHNRDQSSGLQKEMRIYLVYPAIDSTLPDNVIITTGLLFSANYF